MKFSVAIPTYEQFGKGPDFLDWSLEMLKRQTYRDFEVVVSDNSKNQDIAKICALDWGIPIRYCKNLGRNNMSGNINNAIKNCQGQYIKLLFLDDCLMDEKSLAEIAGFSANWLVTGCSNHLDPYYSEDLRIGRNTIGSPSVLTIKNDNPLLFNEDLTWVADCEYYLRLFKRYGYPTVINTKNVEIGLGKHQLTNHLSDELKQKELDWLCASY